MNQIDSLQTRFAAEIAQAGDLEALEKIRIAALGKKGALADLMKALPTLPIEERKPYGAAVKIGRAHV